MKPVFLHRFEIEDAKSRREVLLALSIRKSLRPEAMVHAIETEINENLVPDQLLFAVPSPAFEDTAALLREDPTVNSLLKRLQSRATITLVGFDRAGAVSKTEHIAEPEAPLHVELTDLSRRGITSIFRNRGGFIEGSNTYHFVSPSGRHTNQFIRLSNLLVSGAEIGFLAFSCLPFIEPDIEDIVIDTPVLYSVTSTINEIRAIFGQDLLEVECFGSYDGIERLKDTVFQKRLALISASSSGGLADRLKSEKRFEASSLVHLVYLGHEKSSYPVVCDLSYDEAENPYGITDIPQTYDNRESCALCQMGSFEVRLHGDQFDIKGPQPTPLLIKMGHAPSKLSNTALRFAGTGAFSVLVGADLAPRQRRVFVDTSKLEQSADFKDRLDYVLKRSLPASTSHVIAVDELSLGLAETTKRFLSERGKAASLVERDQVDHVFEKEQAESILVVCSAIESGRCLTDISRDLRTRARRVPIHYLVGFEKTTALSRRESLAKTLVQNTHVLNHDFVCVERMVLPASSEPTAWKSELSFLEALRASGICGAAEKDRLERRIALLQKSNTPITNDLFWASDEKQPLALQPGFVFWNGKIPEGYSQADVWFTMASILQQLRANAETKKEDSAIRSSWYHQTVLDPENFSRFNDDLIQAALLRAARPSELNYSESPLESRSLARTIVKIISTPNILRSGAALEFLVALATRRLRLTHPEDQAVIESARQQSGMIKCVGDWLAMNVA